MSFLLLRVSLCLALGGTLLISSSAADATFAGDWDTTYGQMKVTVEGAKAKGVYQFAGGVSNDIGGTIVGWEWRFTYSEPNVTGEGTFTLSADGQSFSGKWRETGTEQWQSWAGKRAKERIKDFSGVWKTSFGSMRLVQKDAKVTGCYSFQGSPAEISGAVNSESGALRLTYTEPTGDKGSAEFALAADGESFSGTWKTDDGKQGGKWEGTRITPLRGRTWLVILEAHWESGLQQQEYSYGDMLRQFFTRVPSVAVRHRYFDGKQDFAKWCSELAYLTEPVVFYVASHGTEKGIKVGREILDGEFIGKQLRFAPEIKLVHLGACSAMSGQTPVELRKASGLAAPVSGFTKVADWAGSAVIDFSYLDLVLTRKVPPAEAVRQILKSVLFAGEKEVPDCAIPPAGLKIVE